MPLYTKKEFSKICGIDHREFSAYKGRGKVVLNGENIDTDNPINARFLEKRQLKAQKEALTTAHNAGQKEVEVIERPVKSNGRLTGVVGRQRDNDKTEAEPIGRELLMVGDLNDLSPFALDRYQQIKDIEKRTEEIKLLELRKEKLNGELIPLELLKPFVISHSESIKMAYYQAAESMIVVWAQRFELTNAARTEMKTHLTDTINKAIVDAIDSSMKGIKNIVKEYSQKKGVGQHG
jgi:hypothetical protein